MDPSILLPNFVLQGIQVRQIIFPPTDSGGTCSFDNKSISFLLKIFKHIGQIYSLIEFKLRISSVELL